MSGVDFYSQVILPRLCDFVLNKPLIAHHRQELLSHARGNILEIGFGTGLNVPYYPLHVRRITTVDPNIGMHRRARRRIEQAGVEVECRVLSGESLPFNDDCFDCVVSTFTLCSIQSVQQALAEAFRVLMPGGKLLFLEHGLSPEPNVQKWQRRLNWLQMKLAGGCHLDRDIPALITTQSFTQVRINEFYLEKSPKTHGYLYRGIAMK